MAKKKQLWGNFLKKICAGGEIFYFLEDSAPLACLLSNIIHSNAHVSSTSITA
jgi:hypothetical protein